MEKKETERERVWKGRRDNLRSKGQKYGSLIQNPYASAGSVFTHKFIKGGKMFLFNF